MRPWPFASSFESSYEYLKVETPIHNSIRELVTWECKEPGVNIMNVLANPKGSVGRWNLKFWRLEQF
jgi:hypothetical protein